jgi:NifU-like protein involved in Fe-S cluster formation
MPCSDSSSSINLRIDNNDRLISFEYLKMTCGQEITADSGLSHYLAGQDINEILEISFIVVARDLKIVNEEELFILNLELDAVKSAIVHYIGIEHDSIDKDRCQISSINYNDGEIEVAEVILPPKELPKIISCAVLNN